jgi:hypothetical protein
VFAATWGDLDAAQLHPDLALEIEVDGRPASYPYLLAAAGEDDQRPVIRLIAADETRQGVLVQLVIEPSLFIGGTTVELHGFETVGMVVRLLGPERFELIGFVGDGQIVLDEASTTTGQPVSGRFAGRFVQTAWD